jgi:hypothetical protein
MATITDDFMRQMISQTKTYTIVILEAGPNKNFPGVEKIIWEHGRRNFSLRKDGVLSKVCPISDGSDTSGIGIFNASVDEVKAIMEGDPGVSAPPLILPAPASSMDFDLLPNVSLRSRSINALVATTEMSAKALNRNLNLQRFKVLYVNGNYSSILSRLDRRFQDLIHRRLEEKSCNEESW